ncbi:SDR family oxidoreductase [Sinomicrobium weinanense]|uniref:SDR family oxidoreductase n=1 Tax=Sinomicrobium weinanense TaxID=2842200 RepID=A0A926JRZ7_9FLAO|nr:SDR family oxidoreductase [Sinomicrobium weinanense]MBC9796415.1 SDR family oxidoreductase [Sinomicrobium weinanense]MBU3125911.1 SDR family oxidoreductase [Sinomicrobium weinanense]
MILVTGATGQFGSKAVEHLLKKGIDPSEISVLVRDSAKADHLKEKGVQIKEGDYTHPASMVQAFRGVKKLLLVSSNNREAIENRTQHHKNAIMAAKEAGVKQIVYTSFVRKPGFENSAIADFQNSHIESEQYLKQSGVAYTILQNGIYAEMILAFVGDKTAETETILFPAGEGKASWVVREELAEAVAHVLITEGHENKTYTLTNTASIGFKTIAQEISDVLGKEINYQSPEIGEFKAILEKAGVPEIYIGMFVMWSTALAQQTMDKEDDTLSLFLGRRPRSVSRFLKKVYG